MSQEWLDQINSIAESLAGINNSLADIKEILCSDNDKRIQLCATLDDEGIACAIRRLADVFEKHPNDGGATFGVYHAGPVGVEIEHAPTLSVSNADN